MADLPTGRPFTEDELREFNSPLSYAGESLDPMERAKQKLRDQLGRPGLPKALFDTPPSWGETVSPWEPRPGGQFNLEDRRDEPPTADVMRGLGQSAYRGLPQFSQDQMDAERPPHTELGAQAGSTYLPWQPGPEVPWKEKTGLNYNTPLSPEEQDKYQAWAKQGGKDPAKEEADYDLPGYFKSGGQLGVGGAGEHLTDQFKKPNHPTFSEESQYHGMGGEEGGKWEPLPNDKEHYSFTPGKSNMEYWGAQGLQDYFDKYEKGNKLTLPEEY